jgi:hypothetical protein
MLAHWQQRRVDVLAHWQQNGRVAMMFHGYNKAG